MGLSRHRDIALVDHHTVKVLVTRSSALRMEAGRDSLAGRITQVDLGTLLLREIAGLRFGEHRIPVEIKYQRRIDPYRDTLGLRAFLEKKVYNARFGVLVTMQDDVAVPDPRIVCISLPALLLMR